MNKTRAYLYTIKGDGTLNIHEGYFESGYNKWSKTSRFTPDKGNWCFVSNEPGELHYRKMWMPERDDERAKALYIEYHERKIKECEKNLEMHKRTIAVLKGENYESINLG